MKKLLNLTLALAFFMLSLGAFAQDATHSVGSTHTFKVNVSDPGGDHTGNIYAWTVSLTDGSNVTGKYAFVGDSNGVDVKTAKIQWLAAGDYWVDLTETNKNGACSTVRRVNILVTAGAIDLLVVASDKDGAKITSVDGLTDCNDMSGQIIANPNPITDPSNFGSSIRYFTVSMTTDNQPWISGAWGFEFTTSVAATVTSSAGGAVSGTSVAVDAGTSQVILAVTTANTPGASPANDITLNLVGSNAFITTTAGNSNEHVDNAGNNTPDSFIITASPETTVITIE